MQRKDWLPSFLTFYLTFPTLNIISKYFSNIVILIRFADVELPCRYAVIKSLLLLLLLLLLFYVKLPCWILSCMKRKFDKYDVKFLNHVACDYTSSFFELK